MNSKARWIAVLALAAILPVCLAQCIIVKQASDCAILSKAASYTVPPPDRTDQVLADLGYGQEFQQSHYWHSLSPQEKWETAWMAAERGTPQGGRILIDQAAKNLSKQFESAASLVESVRKLGVPRARLRFALLAEPALPDTIPREIRGYLSLLADYCEGAIGGVYSVLRDVFGLSREQAIAVLHGSSDPAHALELGLTRYVPDKEAALTKLVERIDKSNPMAAFFDHELDPFRPKERRVAEIRLRQIHVTPKPETWAAKLERLLKGLEDEAGSELRHIPIR